MKMIPVRDSNGVVLFAEVDFRQEVDHLVWKATFKDGGDVRGMGTGKAPTEVALDVLVQNELLTQNIKASTRKR